METVCDCTCYSYLRYETGNHRWFGKYVVTGPAKDFPVQLACYFGYLLYFFIWSLLIGFLLFAMNPLLALAPLFCAFASCVNYTICAFIDPGIVPRSNTMPINTWKKTEEEEEEEMTFANNNSNTNDETNKSRASSSGGDAAHVGLLLEQKKTPDESSLTYCHYCKNDRTPEQLHRYCIHCDACCLELDHHCGVTGQCIGARNKFHFVFLIFFLQSVWWFSAINLLLVLLFNVLPDAKSSAGFNIFNWVLGALEMGTFLIASFCEYEIVCGTVIKNPYSFTRVCCFNWIYPYLLDKKSSQIGQVVTLCETQVPRDEPCGVCCVNNKTLLPQSRVYHMGEHNNNNNNAEIEMV